MMALSALHSRGGYVVRGRVLQALAAAAAGAHRVYTPIRPPLTLPLRLHLLRVLVCLCYSDDNSAMAACICPTYTFQQAIRPHIYGSVLFQL